MKQKMQKIYCVQWDTMPWGVANVTVRLAEPRCVGRGHTAPGHYAHVRAATPTQAIMKALGWGRRRAKAHLEWLKEEYGLDLD